MSALPHSLTVPLSSADMNASLAKAAQLVIEAINVLTEMHNFHRTALTPDNLAAGYLVEGNGVDITTGQPVVRSLTQDEYDRYNYFFAQVGDIVNHWTNAVPPVPDVVSPWMAEFRVTAPLRPTPPVPPTP